jgi:hypothetical protein
MKKTVLPGMMGLLAGLGLIVLLMAQGCAPAVPKPIVVMANPTNGQRAAFYREIWYKVPRGYDEQKHIEQWKAEKRKEGYTVQVQP